MQRSKSRRSRGRRGLRGRGGRKRREGGGGVRRSRRNSKQDERQRGPGATHRTALQRNVLRAEWPWRRTPGERRAARRSCRSRRLAHGRGDGAAGWKNRKNKKKKAGRQTGKGTMGDHRGAATARWEQVTTAERSSGRAIAIVRWPSRHGSTGTGVEAEAEEGEVEEAAALAGLQPRGRRDARRGLATASSRGSAPCDNGTHLQPSGAARVPGRPAGRERARVFRRPPSPADGGRHCHQQGYRRTQSPDGVSRAPLLALLLPLVRSSSRSNPTHG